MESSNPILSRNLSYFRTGDTVDSMTLQGVINKTGILLTLCGASAVFSWTHPDLHGPLILLGLIGGLVACLVGTFKPTTSPIAAPLYAIFEGLCLGAISQIYDVRLPGIVANAMLLTFGVLGVMLVLYTTRTVRVTDRMVMGVVIATAAVGVVYLVDLALNMFGIRMGYLHSSGPIGIAISLVIVGIAAFNLLIDFKIIEDRITNRNPRYMEWYCGMALMVTLVWLYLEMLRLLSKLRSK